MLIGSVIQLRCLIIRECWRYQKTHTRGRSLHGPDAFQTLFSFWFWRVIGTGNCEDRNRCGIGSAATPSGRRFQHIPKNSESQPCLWV